MTLDTLFALCACLLVGIGLYGLIVQPHPLRKLVAFNVMGSGVFLVFGALAKRGAGAGLFADPVPQALLITAIVVASFALCVWLTGFSQPNAFFILFARIWEFGVGGLLAVIMLNRGRVFGERVGAVAGWAGLAAVVGSGVLFSEALFGKALTLDHKTLFAFASWSIFAILLVGRHAWGWRGRKALHWTLAGFTVLLLAYVGSRFVAEVILGRI